MRVRTRVNAGAWQGLQQKAHGHAILTPTLNSFRKRVKKGGRGGSSRFGIYTGHVEQQDQPIFFFAVFGQTAAWARLVGRHRVPKRF